MQFQFHYEEWKQTSSDSKLFENVETCLGIRGVSRFLPNIRQSRKYALILNLFLYCRQISNYLRTFASFPQSKTHYFLHLDTYTLSHRNTMRNCLLI